MLLALSSFLHLRPTFPKAWSTFSPRCYGCLTNSLRPSLLSNSFSFSTAILFLNLQYYLMGFYFVLIFFRLSPCLTPIPIVRFKFCLIVSLQTLKFLHPFQVYGAVFRLLCPFTSIINW